jgi:hypothetical protein
MVWPANYSEQLLYTKQLQERLEKARTAISQVVVYSLSAPTQSAWETAYVTQTGRGLPILPGTRLTWIDPTTGRVRAFSTTYDRAGGEESSGNVLEQISSRWPHGGLRLLGSSRASLNFSSVHTQDTYFGQALNAGNTLELFMVMPFDLVLESANGLVALWIIGRAIKALDLRFDARINNAIAAVWQDPTVAASFQTSGLRMTMTTSSSTASTAPPPLVAAGNFASSSTAPFMLFITNPAMHLRTADNTQQPSRSGLRGTSLAAYIAQGNVATLEMTTFVRYTSQPIYNGIQGGSYWMNYISTTKFQKAFIYGLYANNEAKNGVFDIS